MKQLLLTIFAIMMAASNVWGQEVYADGYMTEETRPNALTWLPEPPALTSAEFTYDFYYYQWGRTERDGAGGDLALIDESEPLDNIFGTCIGLTLDRVTTPEILLLVERAVTDAQAANKKVKDFYQRTRPFAQFKEASLKPWTDDEEAETFSYPSGHSSRGWMYAFVFASLVPDLAESLFSRALVYAMNRVICGHHWKTDTDASLMLAAGIFATIAGTDAYQEQLKKARAEYQKLKGNTRIDAPTEPAASRSATIYDMQGRQLNAQPNNGVYIQNGQKFISK